MIRPEPLRVAVLVDLPRSPQSGGHVKCWERLAAAAATSALPLDLTVYFSGPEKTEIIGSRVRFRYLSPVFSTTSLTFLPYMPAATDLSPWHSRLARELTQYDVIHTTDGFFAFAQTAARVSRRSGIPLVTSVHTDTPAYARIFTRQTIEKLFRGIPQLRTALIENWRIPEWQGQRMARQLERHIRACDYVLVTRDEDHAMADAILGHDHVRHLRLGVDHEMFGPDWHDRTGIEKDYHIPAGRTVVLFVGRVDVGKNIYTLVGAMEKLIAEGLSLHLIVAGIGPASADVAARLAGHVSLPGFIEPKELARLYASVDVLALCSEVEIRSMVGVEAMASGCPALVSRQSGVWELYNHTQAMQVVDSGIDNWAAALRAFVHNPEKQNQMRTDAAIHTRNHLASWQDVLAQDLLTVWQEAARVKEKALLSSS